MSKSRSLTASRKQEELADIEAKTSEVTNWIEDVLKEKLPPKKDLRENLVDGVILCKLVNVVKTNCVKKYHRRPKMTMMKMENIAFFLAACKSRCGIPPALLFAPSDLQDGDITSMRKVLNVLLLLKQEAGGGPSAEQAAKKLAEEEAAREAAISKEAEEAKNRGEAVYEEAATQSYDPPAVEEPEIPEDDDDEPEPEPEPPKPVKAAAPAKTAASTTTAPAKTAAPATTTAAKTTTAPTKTSTNNSGSEDYSWYISGKTSEYVDVQNDLLAEITSAVHTELSIDAKKKLLESLRSHVQELQQRIITTPDLKPLAHEMGLGHTLADVPSSKNRQWYLDFIMKYGKYNK